MNGIELFNFGPRSLFIIRGKRISEFSISPTRTARVDRTKTYAEVERPICADSAPSKLDAELIDHYKAALANSLRAKTFNQGKKRWVRERNVYVDEVYGERDIGLPTGDAMNSSLYATSFDRSAA